MFLFFSSLIEWCAAFAMIVLSPKWVKLIINFPLFLYFQFWRALWSRDWGKKAFVSIKTYTTIPECLKQFLTVYTNNRLSITNLTEQFLTVYNHYWLTITISDSYNNSWMYTTIKDSLQQLQCVYNNIPDCPQQFLTVHNSSWLSTTVPDCPQEFLTVYNSSWLSTTVPDCLQQFQNV